MFWQLIEIFGLRDWYLNQSFALIWWMYLRFWIFFLYFRTVSLTSLVGSILFTVIDRLDAVICIDLTDVIVRLWILIITFGLRLKFVRCSVGKCSQSVAAKCKGCRDEYERCLVSWHWTYCKLFPSFYWCLWNISELFCPSNITVLPPFCIVCIRVTVMQGMDTRSQVPAAYNCTVCYH